MKLKFFASAAALLACMVASAAKPTLYINEIQNSAKTRDAWTEVVRGAMVEGINKTKRTIIVDAKTESTRFEEDLRRLSDNASGDDMETLKNLETRGAHAILSADVTSLSVNGTRLDNGSTVYDASINVTVNVVNALDGAVLASKSFTFTNELIGTGFSILKNSGKTEDEAVQNTKKNIVKAMKSLVDEAFPLRGKVETIETTKGNKAETFYALVGSEDGVTKGTKFDIKIEQQIGKSKALKKIGECEVIEVAGDDICLCKVKKGGEELKKAFDGEQTVFVTTKE